MIERTGDAATRTSRTVLLALLLAVPAMAQTGMPTPTTHVYGPYTAHNQYGESIENLDAYLHPAATLPSPVLVEIHGGGWSKGQKSAFGFYLPNSSNVGVIEKAYASGMAVISLNYPLSEVNVLPGGAPNPSFPGNVFPVPEEAARKALQFLRKNASAWNVDPDRVFLIGGSAGGHISLWTAMKKDLRDPLETDPNELAYYSSRVSGVVSCWTPTYLDKHHMQGTPARPAVWHHFGYTTDLDFINNVTDVETYAASPGWLATHGGDDQGEHDALAPLNAAVPILGVYEVMNPVPTCSVTSGLPIPSIDVHGYIFGLFMREAFRTVFSTSSPWFTVNCSGTVPLDWADFSFELFPSSPTPAQKDTTSSNVVNWLQAHASALTARLTPDPLPGYSPLHIGWHVNFADQSSSAFLAAQASDPTNNHIDAGVWYGGNFVYLPYETLASMAQSGLATIAVTANAIDITLNTEISQYFPTYGSFTSTVQVKRSGSTTVQKTGVYSP